MTTNSTSPPADTLTSTTNSPQATGKAGDFDFLNGSWSIQHRRCQGTSSEQVWDEFTGEATCWSILGGLGSIEELRIPSRNFFGSGIRLLNVQQQIWADYWVNAKNGILNLPGQLGGFENGIGTFLANDFDGSAPIVVRGVWDQITPNSCRWSQAISYDNGLTWNENWIMHWTRIS
jgi:hypothetical protein